MISCEPIWQDVKTEKAPDPRQGDLDRLEALVHQLDADSPLVLDEDANDSLAGEKGHAARHTLALRIFAR